MKKTFLVIGGIAAATLLVGGWALAQSPGYGPGGFGPGGMMGMHRPMGPGMNDQMGQGMRGQMGPGMRGQMGPRMHGGPGMTQFDPARIDILKTELGITSAQEPAWTKYAKAVQDSAATMQKAREGINPDAISKLSPQDRFALVTKTREQGQKQFETVQTAAKELLATLNDTQKAKAQTSLPGLAFGPGMMHSAGVGGPPFRR
ncbi:MAG: Spy/CpxP family protein refolding chaperone [Betaproteobacteria bacterium]|nr:Spy/CpxP family protein refolding chaperone [Betaproteobacteria bacterium]